MTNPTPIAAHPAPEASEIKIADQTATTVYRYIDGDGISMDATLGAYAQLAVAASIDALRAAVVNRLEELGTVLTDISERLDALDDV